MSTPERRQIPRTTMERLAYIHIEPSNGGIVLNVSPQGLCFHSIAAVEKNGPLRFSLLERNRRIAACGELTWTDEIQKVGGLRFTTLTAEAHEQIQNWITEPTAPPDEHVTSTLGSALLKAFPRFRVHRFDENANFNDSSLVAAWRGVRASMKPSAFGKGLATGLSISVLWACVFLLSAHRRNVGESLIHLGERLAGEQSVVQPAATPKLEKLVISAPKQAPSQAPSLQISKLAPAPTRAQNLLASPTKLPTRPVASAAQSHPATLRPQLPARIVSHPANSPVQPSVVRGTPDAGAPPVVTASPVVPSAPPPTVAPNKPATLAQPEPAQTVQLPGFAAASAVSLPQMFFEVGKFKDELRARDLGDRVAQLGLHPRVVQKGHLWMNAFYVLVGPYGDQEEATRTHQNLLSHGYKPRPFERGSRSFTFVSGLTLAGTTLPVGEFTIDWESYVTDAKVKFAQGNYVLATAAGQWVKRPTRFQRDEYVYLKTRNGLRMLREIHFSGLDRALVFRDSS